VRAAVARCAEACRAGDYSTALDEVAMAMPAAGEPALEAELLVWRAQAHLGMGRPAAAAEAAHRAWELNPSPHACFLLATALAELGIVEESERLLRLGVDLFRDTPQLRVRLAVLLAEEGRVPEALEELEAIPPAEIEDGDLAVFVYGMRANLLAMAGRWEEAAATVRAGLDRYPGDPTLRETEAVVRAAWRRERALKALARSWRTSLEPHEGAAGEVDEVVEGLCLALEVPEVVNLAARRLWRAVHRATGVRPTAVRAWAAAAVVAGTELDGMPASAAALARLVGASPHTTRAALRRIRAFLATLDPQLARRNFAALANPRLEEEPERAPRRRRAGRVLEFPGTRGG